MEKNNYVAILAGGGGTRLWPKSRGEKPKQFLNLVDHKTLFQETLDRVKNKFDFEHIYVVSPKEFVDEIKKEVPQILEENIILEDPPRGTAAAAGLVATTIARKNPQAVISTLASDHYIEDKNDRDERGFLEVLSVSQQAAEKGDFIVTMGVEPTHPHTGLGYIQVGEEDFRIGDSSVFKVANFTEKPVLTTAQDYLATKQYFWNANINSYKASTILSALEKYVPLLFAALEKIGENQEGFEEEWKNLNSDSIDTAILEKAKNVLMVPGSFSWVDVGDWATLHSVLASDEKWNVTLGDESTQHVHLDTEGCLIHGNGKLIATLGIKDLVIVDTPDVLLICPRNKAQEVRKIVEKLQLDGQENYL